MYRLPEAAVPPAREGDLELAMQLHRAEPGGSHPAVPTVCHRQLDVVRRAGDVRRIRLRLRPTDEIRTIAARRVPALSGVSIASRTFQHELLGMAWKDVCFHSSVPHSILAIAQWRDSILLTSWSSWRSVHVALRASLHVRPRSLSLQMMPSTAPYTEARNTSRLPASLQTLRYGIHMCNISAWEWGPMGSLRWHIGEMAD